MFRVANHIRSAALGSLYLSDTARRSVLLVRCWIVAAVVDRLYRINAEGAERIRAMILSDDVSGDDSFDDGTECDGDNAERREGDWESAEDATPDDYCLSEVDATESCFRY